MHQEMADDSDSMTDYGEEEDEEEKQAFTDYSLQPQKLPLETILKDLDTLFLCFDFHPKFRVLIEVHFKNNLHLSNIQ